MREELIDKIINPNHSEDIEKKFIEELIQSSDWLRGDSSTKLLFAFVSKYLKFTSSFLLLQNSTNINIIRDCCKDFILNKNHDRIIVLLNRGVRE